ncbi:BON domain-containing protein [Paraburkholderia sp. Ac-20336]|uniref:BON domain-containing protein n=1 Tax=Burkholderiaceae TaxID=119060 RepID=UPI001423C3DE|nr:MULTISPECIES: BON domain-containing protein [Burkholderiaceae]MBN3802272.1 BON domain-containing protein [Paraburkholderia sp. Ac-20336]MBN3845824.1 BON domain-containing protein [Paraburkholderia sp. Ac-20342]NIF55992.1 BON domain-containing protein [Burkholderia sp. Ax-1724]NIF77400.1 BON domain-containing protein [Paraburkholderia sp. Cy-641]
MKAFPAMKVIGGALVVLASLNAYAQNNDAAASAAAPAAAAASAPTAKQTRQANRAMQRKIRAALAHTKGLTVSNITVRARGGDITLAGSVPEAAQVDLATTAAKSVAGVTSVRNALTIRAIGQ